MLHEEFKYLIIISFSDTPISNKVWNYRTQGLTSVGQDEVVVLLVQLPGVDVVIFFTSSLTLSLAFPHLLRLTF
jgi:hypothetical protein